MSKTYGRTEATGYVYDEEGPEGTRYRDRLGDVWFRNPKDGLWNLQNKEDFDRGNSVTRVCNVSWKTILKYCGPLSEVVPDPDPVDVYRPNPSQEYIVGEAEGYSGLWEHVKDSLWRHMGLGTYALASEFEPGWKEVVIAHLDTYLDLLDREDKVEAIKDFFDESRKIRDSLR